MQIQRWSLDLLCPPLGRQNTFAVVYRVVLIGAVLIGVVLIGAVLVGIVLGLTAIRLRADDLRVDAECKRRCLAELAL